MSYHPFSPVTVCVNCGLTEGSGDHVAPAPSSKVFRSYWVHWNSTVKDDHAGQNRVALEAARRSVMLVNQWDSWVVPIAKRANPAIKVLVYKDASSTRTTGAPFPLGPTGVDYRAAQESWFLHNAQGARMEYAGYKGHWRMDVGRADYQAAWRGTVAQDVRAGGFDGVFVDNLLFTRTQYGPAPREYESDSAFRMAYRSFLSHLREELGCLVFGNLSNARLTAGGWSDYLTYLDGAWDEWWLTFGDAPADRLPEYTEGWSRQLQEVKEAESSGKTALVQPHFTNSTSGRQSFRYSFASYLLVAGSWSAFAEVAQTDGYGTPSPWHLEFDYDLGSPLTPFTTPSSGTAKRYFERGLVLVNARSSGTATFNLGGQYRTDSGALVTSLTLGPCDGAILRAV